MKRPSKWLHIALALVGVLATGFLIVFGRGGGHPPAIVLLPLLLAFWAFGHALVFVMRLVTKGQASGSEGSTPVGVVIALLITGAVGFFGIVQIAGTLLTLNWYPYTGTLWWKAIAVALIHGVDFIGLSLRKPWSRWLSTAISVFWLVIAISNGLNNLGRFRIEQLGEWLVLVGWLSLSALMAFDFATSSKIASYLGSRQKRNSETD